MPTSGPRNAGAAALVGAANQGSWATIANAVGGDDGTLAVWTKPAATNQVSQELELSSFGTFTGPVSGDTINSVTVAVNEFVGQTARMQGFLVSLYDGTTLIGAAQAGANSATTTNLDSIVFTGVSFANLANLRVRVQARGSTSNAQASSGSVDYAAVTVDYTPSQLPLVASGTTTSGGSVGLAGPLVAVVELAADAIGGLADADPVSSWADTSGSGNTVTQATAGSQPSYQTVELNSLPVVRFDGGDSLAKTAPVGTNVQAFTIFAVVRPTTLVGVERVICAVGDSTGGRVYRFKPTGEQNLIKSDVADLATGTTQHAVGTAVVLAVTYAASGAINFYKTGNVADGSATPAAASFADGTPVLRVGSHIAGAQEFYIGDIAHIRFFPQVLSSADRAAQFAELEAKWLGAGAALAATGSTVSGGSATLAQALAVAASGQTSSGGSAAVGVARPIAATGQTTSGGSATLAGSGQANLAATGQTASQGVAALARAQALAAVGQTSSGGTAALTQAQALAAVGQTSSGGAAAVLAQVPQASVEIGAIRWVTVASGLVASGQTASGGTAALARAQALAASGQTASQGVAALARAQALAATGTTASDGTATLALAQALAATGQTASGGAATLTGTGQAALVASGVTVSQGTASLLRALVLAVTGATISGGAVTLVQALALAASGLTASGGTVSLARAQALAASGQTASGGAAILTGTGQAFLVASGATISGGAASLARALPIAATDATSSEGTAALLRALPLAATGQTASGGTVGLAQALAVAASGQTASQGTAALVLAQALAATGTTQSQGAVVVLRLLVASGQTSSGGNAALALALVLAAVGQTSSGGTVSLRRAIAMAASGQTISEGAVSLARALPIAATGQTISDGAATLFVLVGIVPQWRGRLSTGQPGPSVARGQGPAHIVPSGPTGVRGG